MLHTVPAHRCIGTGGGAFLECRPGSEEGEIGEGLEDVGMSTFHQISLAVGKLLVVGNARTHITLVGNVVTSHCG